MSSKKLTLYRLLSGYNSYMWDIIRAYKESEMTRVELVEYLVENEVCISSKTIYRYESLYNHLKAKGYTDDIIDKRSPQAWRNYFNNKKKGAD